MTANRNIGGNGKNRLDGILNQIGVPPNMAVTVAIGIYPGVYYLAAATIERTVNSKFCGSDDVGTGVDDDGRCWMCDSRNALHSDGGVVWNRECVRGYYVCVFPNVIGVVDSVSVDEGGVAATVRKGGGIGAWVECYSGTTVGDSRQDGGEDFRKTVNRSGVVGCWGKSFRIEGIGIGPDGVVSSTVGVSVTEQHRTRVVRVYMGGAVHEFGDDVVSAHVGDGVGGRSHHIHQTGYGVAMVGWHTGDNLRHNNMVSESPGGIRTSTILVSVSVCLGACAITDLSVDSRSIRRQ